MATAIDFALSYLSAGYSVVPIRPDGSKAPAVPSWKSFMTRRASEDQVRAWYQSEEPLGVAIVLGTVSKGLQVLDFDQPGFWERFVELVVLSDPMLLTKLPHVLTPSGGHHLYYRQGNPLSRKVLAKDRQEQTAIELRGESNYCLAPGCPGSCHPSGKTYDPATGSPRIEDAPALDPGEITVLVESAKALNEWIQPGKVVEGYEVGTDVPDPKKGTRPGDDFNARADWGKDVLEPFGWVRVKTGPKDGEILWRRPGKEKGVSASTGFCKSETGGDLLWVFSTNASPLRSDRGYSKFSALAALRGIGFPELTAELAETGYGAPPVDLVAERIAALLFPSGEVDQAKLDLLRENDKKFRDAWLRRRKDLSSQSASSYCMALATIAKKYAWEDQEVINLLISWRKKEKEPDKPPEWYVGYLLRAVEREIAVDLASDGLIEGGKGQAETLEYLSTFLGFKVLGFVQNCRENAVYSLLTETGEIELGNSSQLMSQKHVRGILFDLKDCTLRIMPEQAWLDICATLKKICVVKNPDEALGADDALDWIEDHVTKRKTIASDESEEGWMVAVPKGRPFLKDGTLWINAVAIMNSVRDHGGRVGRSVVLNRLRQLGFAKKVHSGFGRTRSYWGIAEGRLRDLREDLWRGLFDRSDNGVPF